MTLLKLHRETEVHVLIQRHQTQAEVAADPKSIIQAIDPNRHVHRKLSTGCLCATGSLRSELLGQDSIRPTRWLRCAD